MAAVSSEEGVLMVGWFCPYAQRVWIAAGLSTLKCRIDKHAMELDREREPRFMLASSELADATPAGSKPTVPTLRLGDRLVLNDSILVVEFVPRTGDCITGAHYNIALRHLYWHVGADGDRNGASSVVRVSDLRAVLAEAIPHIRSVLRIDRAAFD